MSSTSPEARVLGEFVLREKLGEGGFGTVYRAEQKTLDRPAVIKVMRPALAARQEAVDRFVLEARLASRFDHPYAAHVYAFGAEPDGLLWIAMELVRGTPLSELVATSGPLTLDRFVPLMERLCEVIQSAHDQGIVHRDIKPSNIMVIARSGRLMPKLLDFGIAKAIGADEAPKVKINSARAKRPTERAGEIPEHTPAELERTAAAVVGTGSGRLSNSNIGTSPSITVEGQILGSPPYMAPEQWMDASRVGPWTDQYALAMAAYEVLTGARAFSGTTISELASSHMYKELPPLPQTIPPAVHAVLSKASAKEPEARYANLNELAAALRVAASPSIELEERVDLPSDLAAWVADAPRPLADAIAALASARSPVRVSDRVTSVATVLAHWLGVLAIACRSRLGKTDATAGLELIRELRKRPLRDEEWLDLAVALTKPFAAKPETWPIPELVTLVSSDAFATLRALIRGEGALALVGKTTSIEHQTATARIGQLVAVLQAAAWLLDYEVARETADGLELWMGTRADESLLRRARERGESGRIVLLDADGARVLALSPLLAVSVPTAGEREQLFLLAGPGRAPDTARYVAAPHGFEHEREDTWSYLASHVLDLAQGAAKHEAGDRSPFPGLTAFTAKDQESFVGREREVEELINRLRRQRMVAVVGPSGVGKSSFLAAGVVPALPSGWTAEIVRPGGNPIAALASALERGIETPYRGQWKFDTAAEPKAIAANLIGLAEQREQTLVIVIDQGEELFTMCSDETQRIAFAQALVAAAASQRIRVVLGVRDDFFCRVEDLAPWRKVFELAQILRVPSAIDLERIVTVPAARRGYEFDDPQLPKQIVSEVAGRPGAMPLLAFTTAQLWDQRDRHFNRLTRAAYDRLGGVTGALVQHADGVVDGLPAQERRLVRLAFKRLFTAEGTRALISRSDLIAALGGTPLAQKTIDHLVAARLLVVGDDDAGERIEIVHEALATMWPRLAEWRREDVSEVRNHQQLATAAKAWDERGRAAGLLWRGDALAELRRWRARSEFAMTPIETAFADASERAAKKQRRTRVGLVATAFGALTAGLVVLGSLNRVVASQRADAVSKLAASLEERGRVALLANDSARALVYLTEAKRLGMKSPAFDLLATRAARSFESQVHVYPGYGKAMFQSAYDAKTIVRVVEGGAEIDDRATGAHLASLSGEASSSAPLGDVVVTSIGGDVVATGRDGSPRWRVAGQQVFFVRGDEKAGLVLALSYAGTAKLFELATGKQRAELTYDQAEIKSGRFDHNASRVATGDATGAVHVWDLDGHHLATCPPHAKTVNVLYWSADSKLVYSAGNDRIVAVCDTTTGTRVRVLEGHVGTITSLHMTPDGHYLLSAGNDSNVRIWDTTTGLVASVLEGHRGPVLIARFSPDGTYVATAGSDTTVRIWDPTAGTELAQLQLDGLADSLEWEPSGREILTTSSTGSIGRWNIEQALNGVSSRRHTSRINDLGASADGRFVVTSGNDGTVIWDVRTNKQVHALRTVSNVSWARFSPDSRHLLITDGAGAVSLWDVESGAMQRQFSITDATVANFVPNSDRIATSGKDGNVRIWERDGRELVKVAIGFAAAELYFDPAAKWIVCQGIPGDPKNVDLPVIDLATSSIVVRLHGKAPPFRVAVDATRIAATDDKLVRIWEFGTWRELGVLDGYNTLVQQLAFLPDGRILTTGEDRRIIVWDRAGQPLTKIQATTWSWSVAVSPDGTMFATGMYDGTLHIWDATSYRDLFVRQAHLGRTSALTFTSDSRHLVSVGADGRVDTWDVSHPTRSLGELDHLVKCRVPYRFVNGDAQPRQLDLDDPSCR